MEVDGITKGDERQTWRDETLKTKDGGEEEEQVEKQRTNREGDAQDEWRGTYRGREREAHRGLDGDGYAK